MLFDIGWPELVLIGVVALVVIGPKDLPRAMRIAGYWMRKARTLSREFQNSVDQMIREAELEEVRQDLKKATEFNIEAEFHKAVDADGTLAESVKPPELPNFFVESEGPVTPAPVESHPLSNGAAIAPELPLPADTPEPDFVGFEPAGMPSEPAHETAQQRP